MSDGGWPEGVREFDHTADTGIELEAPDAASLFDRAARALRALAVPEGEADAGHRGAGTRARPTGSPLAGHEVVLAGADPALLLVRWLSALLYRIDSLGLAYESADIELGESGLRATVREVVLAAPGASVKAVTHHGARCGPRPDGVWEARVIFDV